MRVVAALLALTGLAGCVSGEPSAGPTPSATDVVGENGGVQHSAPGAPDIPGVMPTDLVTAPSAACAQVKRPAGWLAGENRLPGDAGWKAASTWGDKPDMGWLDQASAACGDTVHLHLSGTGASVAVAVYRIGWYGGAGARLVTTLPPVAAPTRPAPAKNQQPPLYTVETSWPVSEAITIPPSWPPGFYLLEMGPAAAAYAIPLIVRDDPGGAPLLFQASVLTYQAYNGYGGYSLYQGHDATEARTDRSRTASFDRPYGGTGYLNPFWYDIPLAQRIEQDGIDVDYTTDTDVDLRPSQLLQHSALVIGGHSEYWTTRMYDAVEVARDHGMNIAFFGANAVYWHARLDASPTGPDRRITVYRVLAEDPVARTDPADATVEWREQPLDRPEHVLVGAMYEALGVTGSYRVLDPSSWIFAGTGVHAGQVLRNSLGGEYDKVLANDPLTPPNIAVIAAAPIMLGPQATMSTMSYYTAPSGAGVFSAGTTYWPCQLGGTCYQMPVDPGTRQVLEQMTDNVLRAFAAGPAARAHPGSPLPPPSPDYLVTTAAAPQDVAVRG